MSSGSWGEVVSLLELVRKAGFVCCAVGRAVMLPQNHTAAVPNALPCAPEQTQPCAQQAASPEHPLSITHEPR